MSKELKYKPVDLLENNPSPDQKTLICSGLVCPYCSGNSELIDSKLIYGKSYANMYYCGKCDAYVGVHQGTKISLGRLANKELRICKKKAHNVFDPMWRKKMELENISKYEARTLGYKWLSKEMGIESKFCHIGMMNVEQCREVIKICSPFAK
jgi:hypothetical protein